MEEQKEVTQKGATMRLGAFPCQLQAGSIAQKAYQTDLVHERHRHRYEFNNQYLDVLRENGLRIGGMNPERKLVEIAEITNTNGADFSFAKRTRSSYIGIYIWTNWKTGCKFRSIAIEGSGGYDVFACCYGLEKVAATKDQERFCNVFFCFIRQLFGF